MIRYIFVILVILLFSNSANAFMMGSDITEMVTAPFTLHRTNGNESMPRFMQKAEELFTPEEEEVDLSGYIKAIQAKINSNFNPPEVEGSPSVVILFKITTRGRLDSFKILKSSGNELYDHAAVRAIQMSAPFDYLPSGYEKELLKVQYTFSKHATSVNYF